MWCLQRDRRQTESGNVVSILPHVAEELVEGPDPQVAHIKLVVHNARRQCFRVESNARHSVQSPIFVVARNRSRLKKSATAHRNV